jgi:hypothetical protein
LSEQVIKKTNHLAPFGLAIPTAFFACLIGRDRQTRSSARRAGTNQPRATPWERDGVNDVFALKGRNSRPGIGLLRPFRAWSLMSIGSPGRCPGLSFLAPSGQPGGTPIHCLIPVSFSLFLQLKLSPAVWLYSLPTPGVDRAPTPGLISTVCLAIDGQWRSILRFSGIDNCDSIIWGGRRPWASRRIPAMVKTAG